MDQGIAKMRVGKEASRYLEDGMTIGLGTGSTASCAIAAIGERIRTENLHIRGIPTSRSAEFNARRHGIPICTLEDLDGLLDLAFDGADEVSPDLDLIKGRGAAHTLEKLVASQAHRFVVLVDQSKMVDQLGSTAPVPIEVIPSAATVILRQLHAMGATASVRNGIQKDGPVVTDLGFWVIDAQFGAISNPTKLSHTLLEIPGVLDHGIFVGLATEVIVGSKSAVKVIQSTSQ